EIWLPFGEMARAGVQLAGSSDDPCAFREPLRTSAYGATRRTGSGGVLGAEQALGYEEWLRAYTAGAAYAGGQEDERGSITPGKRADLVVVEGDLDAEHPPRVVQTWIGGERAMTTRDPVSGRGPTARVPPGGQGRRRAAAGKSRRGRLSGE